jgi:hypothetical protein
VAADPYIPPGRAPGPLTREHPHRRRTELDGVEVSLARTEYRRGDSVEPVVRASGDSVRVGLVCTERYLDTRGQRRPTLRAAVEWESWGDLVVPRDAPYSHEGTVLAISWAVVVRVPRRWRPDARVWTPIWVSP